MVAAQEAELGGVDQPSPHLKRGRNYEAGRAAIGGRGFERLLEVGLGPAV